MTGAGGMTGAQGGMGGGTGGDGAGGTAGSGGGTYTCTNMVGMAMGHTHPLTIPGSDIENQSQAAPYILEDGGTGHTHELLLTAYEIVFLNAQTPVTSTSSTTNGHEHSVDISCTYA